MAWQQLGAAHVSLKLFERAIPYFQKSIALDTTFAQPHHGLGTAYMRLGRQEEGLAKLTYYRKLQTAFAEYERLARLTYNDPTNLQGWQDFTRLLMDQRRYPEAVQSFQKCIELDPNNPSHYHGLAQAFINLDYLIPARQAINQALNIKPDAPILYNALGSIYAMEGMPQNGIQAFQQAVGLAPDVPYFHLNLARLYEQVGNQKKADEHYEQYKQLKPDEEPP